MSILSAYVKVDGEWQRVLTAQDSELKSGKVGLAHWEYGPRFSHIKVESVQ